MTDGIVRDLVGARVPIHIVVELDVAHDGVTQEAQPAGLPTGNREVASDRVVLEVAIGGLPNAGR